MKTEIPNTSTAKTTRPKTMAGRLRAACATKLLLLLLLTLPGVAQAQVPIYYYTVINGTATILQYDGNEYEVTIPDTLGGYPVTRIGDLAFKDCAWVNSITNSPNVTSMGEEVFSGCIGLTNIVLGNNLTNIGYSAFFYCLGLTKITIPDSVTTFGAGAICSCRSLTNIVIGSGLTNIPDRCLFIGCDSLRTITVDPANPCFSSLDGVLFSDNGMTLHRCPNGRLGSYGVPGTVTSIRRSAFDNCRGLTHVTISGNVTNIAESAFYLCTGLTSVTIGGNVTDIAYSAFRYCLSLTSLTIPDSVTNIGESAFSACTNLTSVTFGNGVLSIEETAFENCFNLTSLTIPDSVTSIGEDAFDSCTSLTTVRFGNGVTNIPVRVFEGCSRLNSVTFGSNVTSIRDSAFMDCASLSSVTIPSSVTLIEDYAFVGCTNLIAAYFKGNPPICGYNAFKNDNNAIVYYLPGAKYWGKWLGMRPTALWGPKMETTGCAGVGTNQFGFNVNWSSGMVVVVEACTNVVNHAWSPVATNSLAADSFYYSDAQWRNYPGRFYRLRSP